VVGIAYEVFCWELPVALEAGLDVAVDKFDAAFVIVENDVEIPAKVAQIFL
jgi:hypothetical protein